MLRHRVIPMVLLDGYSVIKTINFDVRRNLGNPITVARIYNTRNVDELVLLDIDASKEGRTIDTPTVEEVASECFMPLTVGGGLRSCDDIAELLARGADRVVLNTAALETPSLIREASNIFGKQCILVSIDVKFENGQHTLYSHAGKEPDFDLMDFCREAAEQGAGELVINSVDRDGMMDGYDLPLIQRVCEQVRIPVIAAGGAGIPRHAVDAIRAGAAAVAAASMFHFTDFTPNDIKLAFHEARIPVRLPRSRPQPT